MQRRATASAETLLDTPRLRLRPPAPEDAPAFDALLADAEAMRFSETGPRPADGAAWVAAEREALAAHGICRLAVTLREDGAVIGYCGLRRDPTHPAARQAALSLRLLTPRRGRGYGREAAGAALVHGFLALGLVRVVARLEARNAAAIRAVETVGLRLEGLEIRPGDGRPRQLYALERPL